MASLLLPAALYQAFDAAGAPLSGAKIKLFLAGTTTPALAYSTPGLAVSIGTEIAADSAGRFPAIWLSASQAYRAVLTTATDVTVAIVDPVNVADAPTVSTVEQAFTGDGVARAFTLIGVDVSTVANLFVLVAGVYQALSSLAASSDGLNTVVTLAAAPANGAVVLIRVFTVQGARGEAGPPGALTWAFDPLTADADPGAGKFRANAASLVSITQLFVSDRTEFGEVDVSAFLLSLTASTSLSHKGFLLLKSSGAQGSFGLFRLSGEAEDAAGYVKFPVQHVASAGTWAEAEVFGLTAAPMGDRGDAGVGGATVAADIGDGAASSFVLLHNLNTRDLTVTLRRNADPWDVVIADVRFPDLNSVTISTAPTVPTAGQFRAVIQRTL